MGKSSATRVTRSARNAQQIARPTQKLRSESARPDVSQKADSSGRDNESPAVLELSDIVVAVAAYSKSDDEHRYLTGYEYKGGDLYDDEVACWISTEKPRYCLHIGYEGTSLPYQGAALCADVRMDNEFVAKTYVQPESMLQRITQKSTNMPVTVGEMELRGRERSNGTIQPFDFRERKTSSDEKDIPRDIKEFGAIRVIAYWVRRSPSIKSEEDFDPDEPVSDEPVFEQLKEIIEHRDKAGLAQAEVDDEPRSQKEYNYEVVDNDEEFHFVFKYRDIEWLKMKRIAPK